MKPLPSPRRGRVELEAAAPDRSDRRADPASRAARGYAGCADRVPRRGIDVHDGRVDAVDDVREVDERARRRPTAASFDAGADGRVLGRRARPAATEDCVPPPAKIAPTRNATTAVSARVTKVKRRDIVAVRPPTLHYKSQKRLLIQRFHAQLARLLQFAPRVGAEHDRAGLLADRSGDPRAQPLERAGRLFAASSPTSVPVSTKVLPASGPTSSVGSGAWLAMFTPACSSRATSARLRGSSAKARTEAATTGPTSATDCSASTGASITRSIVRN